jgi:hypothetical protein
VIGQNPLQLGERRPIFQHGELAVGIAGIVSRAEFDRIDMERREFLEDRRQWKLRQQGGKDSDTHNDSYLLGITGIESLPMPHFISASSPGSN